MREDETGLEGRKDQQEHRYYEADHLKSELQLSNFNQFLDLLKTTALSTQLDGEADRSLAELASDTIIILMLAVL